MKILDSILYRFASETAKSVIWLLANDPENWRGDRYAMVHRATGIGIWISNGVFGLEVFHHVPAEDRDRPFVLNGRGMSLPWVDRRLIYRAATGLAFNGRTVPAIISTFAMEKHG